MSRIVRVMDKWARAAYLTACAAGMLLALQPLVRADFNAAGKKATLAVVDGADIYGRICAGCHMPDARGARGAGYYPALAGDPALSSKEYMAGVVLMGRRNMPAFGTRHAVGSFYEPIKLDYEQIAAVVNYVRSHFGNHYTDNITAAQIEALDTPP